MFFVFESNRMKLKLEYRFLILRFKIYPKILFEFSVVLKLHLRSGNCTVHIRSEMNFNKSSLSNNSPIFIRV